MRRHELAKKKTMTNTKTKTMSKTNTKTISKKKTITMTLQRQREKSIIFILQMAAEYLQVKTEMAELRNYKVNGYLIYYFQVQ